VKNNHLTYFKIENFKKFDSLEVNDIGQFNLIVGDNNVGKTCLLEALLFDEDGQQLVSNFWIGLTKRGMMFESQKTPFNISGNIVFHHEFPQGNYFKGFERSKHKSFSFVFSTLIEEKKTVSISLISVGGNKQLDESSTLKVPFTNHIIMINKKPFNVYNYDEKILNFPLISFNDTPLEQESRSVYETLKTKREKQILIDVLKVVNPNIVDIELRENFEDLKSVFLISFEDKDEFVPLNFLGDGFKRIFYIVLKALSLKGKRILIDEIEIGIHYSKMKDFWINIMRVCKELDVQLFATTHSQECIESYLEASKETNEKDIRLIRLQENKDKSIKAICYKEEYIEYMVESNTEER
jgi:AAA15 family ATPase/GTPase